MKWSVLFFLFFCSCSTEVNQTLKSASDNKMELYKVFMHYRFVDRNPEKYKATLFLIENMKYHYFRGKITKENPKLAEWCYETDSIYFSIEKDSTYEHFSSDLYIKQRQIRMKELAGGTMLEIESDNKIYLDCQNLSSKFLIEHIDHAFKMWKESKFARHLIFDEFKEYILPYRSVRGYGFHTTGSEYYNLFAKYILSDTSASLVDHIKQYNLTINGLRHLNDKTQREKMSGLYDLYFLDFNEDCQNLTNHGCNILRACGIPMMVDYNISYRDFVGRHSHCSVYDTNKEWKTFNPQASLPGDEVIQNQFTLNYYREFYGAQKNTPFFLKNSGEYIPSVLSSPCIKDVTSELHKTLIIELPFSIETSNRLAYLGTFNKGVSGGLIPVTWGEIDTLSNKVIFEHAMPNIIYFPIYYPGKNLEVFGEPFYVKLDSSGVSLLPIPGIDKRQDSLISLMINRKFPPKYSMYEVAQKLVGGRFLGANKQDFSDAEVLYEIKETPEPYFSHYPLKNKKAYQYYRFQASTENAIAEISFLEWISHNSFNYSNTLAASRPHVTTPDGVSILKNESKYVKLISVEPWDKMKLKAEYDGNMQTSYSAYSRYGRSSSITFELSYPQLVTAVRFSPRNADNGIRARDRFELFYWDDAWRSIGECCPEYEYVTFENIPANKLYWLVNQTGGKEEMLFTMVDGKQSFLYYDMVNE